MSKPLLIPLLFCSLSLSAQQDNNYQQGIRLTFEDDYFKPFWRHMGSIDRDYTTGLKLEYYTTTPKRLWIEKWMPFSKKYSTKSVSFAAGCNMYTPDTLSKKTVDSLDRPYAGWLYLSARAIYNSTQGHPRRITVDYSAGVLGPPALMGQLQKSFHTWVEKSIPSTIPQGWDNQIGTALALNANVRYEPSLWHSPGLDSLVRRQKPEFETFPSIEVNAGSVMDYIRVGWEFTVQTGGDASYFQSERDYNPVYPNYLHVPGSRLQARNVSNGHHQKCITVEFYASPSVTAVAYNATLSGGLIPFQHSPYVLTADRIKRLYGEVDAALVLRIWRFALMYTCTYRTVEFKGADALPSFWAAGSLLYQW